MAKKYKLIKDIPGYKAGTIFVKGFEDHWFPEGEGFVHKYVKYIVDRVEDDKYGFNEWFEEIKETPITFEVYYIRSTGEIVGPNKVTSLGHKLQLRRDYGNLFYSKEEAEKAQKIMKQFLSLYNEVSHYPYVKIMVEGKSCEF